MCSTSFEFAFPAVSYGDFDYLLQFVTILLLVVPVLFSCLLIVNSRSLLTV